MAETMAEKRRRIDTAAMKAMAHLCLPCLAGTLLLAIDPPAARAQPEAAADQEAAAGAPTDDAAQIGLALMPGLGYRFIVPYEDGLDCGDGSGDPTKRVCTAALPAFLDIQAAFGLSPRLDAIADFRLGLVRDGNLSGSGRQFAFAPGIRFWLDQNRRVRLYATLQALFDSTNQGSTSVEKSDFGIRNSNGLMYSVTRHWGIYVQAGETLGLRRWLRLEIDAGLGVQARWP